MYLFRIIICIILLQFGSSVLGWAAGLIGLFWTSDETGKAWIISAGLMLIGGLVLLLGLVSIPRLRKTVPEATALAPVGEHGANIRPNAFLLLVNFHSLSGILCLALRVLATTTGIDLQQHEVTGLTLLSLSAILGAIYTTITVGRFIQHARHQMPAECPTAGTPDPFRREKGSNCAWNGFTLAIVSIFTPVIVSIPALVFSVRSVCLLKNTNSPAKWAGIVGIIIGIISMIVVPTAVFSLFIAAIIH